ncbi:MAG: stage III sporulation protein AB [Clostridia bacterium]|nr:stage III sporulation protein AB [Clostridia bacterium]MDE6758542.1 stage III sporulation protein AB [Clostridia bacterium]MDE7079571.1 stage III sporulation protein AB [Clostridia bacterium]
MLKLAIGGILCFISTYLGITGKRYYDKRYRYLSDFNDFLLALIDGISYSKDRLSEISKKYLASTKGLFGKNLNEFLYLIESSQEEDKIAKCFDCKYLKRADKEYFKEFFLTLGKLDYDTQISRLNLSKAEIEKMLSKAEKDCKSTGNLFSKLGLLLGIAIMIILA